MKYMAIIDADEKPVSCEFIGCNGNVKPYLIGATTNIKELEQESVLDKIRAEISDWQTDIHDNEYDAETHDFVFDRIYEIIDKYKAEGSGKE